MSAASELPKVAANYEPLSPISFLKRAARVYPDRIAVVHGSWRYDYRTLYERARRLAAAIAAAGLKRGDTVAVVAPNVPAHLEAHFGVGMAGCMLNAINTRLDAPAIAFILDHAETKILLTDTELAPVMAQALKLCDVKPLIIDITDAAVPNGQHLGAMDYESFIAAADPATPYPGPADEWDAVALNYTSGTTGNPKGVVCHHRGAYLNALGNLLAWPMQQNPIYLWTLPMFHCNGWCFPWSVTMLAGTHVCLRKVETGAIFDAIKNEGVTYFNGAPTVLNMLINAPAEMKVGLSKGVSVLTAGAAPPATVIAAMEEMGMTVAHGYGLTETYGPSTICAWHAEWDELPLDERARLKARQGVPNPMLEGLTIMNPETMEEVPADGETMGEVMFRGNVVMSGYLKNQKATDDAFRGGWFHSGDLGVLHSNGYIELKDRSKDIIISGGENISTIEVESVLFKHPAVLEAAVVARPDSFWGETPCAFVTLKRDKTATAEEIIAFCRANMAHFKAPKTVIFSELPKTSTGKIQKFALREKAKAL